jgi:hypothetical protein
LLLFLTPDVGVNPAWTLPYTLAFLSRVCWCCCCYSCPTSQPLHVARSFMGRRGSSLHEERTFIEFDMYRGFQFDNLVQRSTFSFCASQSTSNYCQGGALLGKGLSKSRLERTGLDRCRKSIRFKRRSLNPLLQTRPTSVIFLSAPGGTTISLEGKRPV